VEAHAHVPKVGRTWSHWLLEGLFIFISVGLAFSLAQYGEHRADRKLTARVLDGLRQEMADNLALLEPYVPMHRRWLVALNKEGGTAVDGRSGLDVWFATRPELPPGAKSPFPLLRRSAWDATISGNALRLVDFELAQKLSEAYSLQQVVTDNRDRLANGPLAETATYDASARQASVRLLWLTLADVESSEEALLEVYKQQLGALTDAANAAR
jgi:hypothetical protein